MRIVECNIKKWRDPIEAIMQGVNGSARVTVRVDGEMEWQTLFDYFHDELTFTEEDFIGKTVEGAHALFRDRDVEYLTS